MPLPDPSKKSRLVPKYFSRFINQGIWKDTPVPHWVAFAGFVIFTLAILVAGWQIFDHQKQRIKQDRQNELEAIADLKVQQLVQWREDKLWDSELVRNNRLLAKQTGEWISQGMPRNNIYNKLVARMTDQLNAHRLHGLLLLDTNGELLLQVGAGHGPGSHLHLQREAFEDTIQSQ